MLDPTPDRDDLSYRGIWAQIVTIDATGWRAETRLPNGAHLCITAPDHTTLAAWWRRAIDDFFFWQGEAL